MKTNLLIDPVSGLPRWNAAESKRGPKEDFALVVARRLRDGRLSLDVLKSEIIGAANIELARRGESGKIQTLNDVKDRIGKSGKDWFFEIQRVAQDSDLLQQLIDQKGRGLTTLARTAGPIQPQRSKGFSESAAIESIRALTKALELARVRSQRDRDFGAMIVEECEKATSAINRLLKR